MTGVLDKLKKRRSYPVTIDGETVNVRSLTIGELQRMESVEGDDKAGFVLGCALLETDGQRSFIQGAEESDAEFGKRVLAASVDIPTDNLSALKDAINKLSNNIPPQETIRKNS